MSTIQRSFSFIYTVIVNVTLYIPSWNVSTVIGHLSQAPEDTSLQALLPVTSLPLFRAREVTFWHYGHVNRSFYFTYFTLPLAAGLAGSTLHREFKQQLPGNLPGVIYLVSSQQVLNVDIRRWCDRRTWRTFHEKVHLVDSSFIQRPFESIYCRLIHSVLRQMIPPLYK